MRTLEEQILRRLAIDDVRAIEIESKRRVLPEEQRAVKSWLIRRRAVRHLGSKSFFDQYLDTPSLDLLRAQASLRLRYKKNGTFVYLQYKGPGFHHDGLLYRSEFSTERLDHVLLEESHHDVVHFTETSIREILERQADSTMARAIERHLGRRTVDAVTRAPIICLYQKDKFRVELDKAFLEPSLDRIFAFHVDADGLHAMSTFCEYENEIKSEVRDLHAKLSRLDQLLEFDERLAREFDLPVERMDKYHRCATTFVRRR